MVTNSSTYAPGNCLQKSQQSYYAAFELAGNYVQAKDLFKQLLLSGPAPTR